MPDALLPFDAAGYRARTPGVAAAIHLNAASAALPPAGVVAAMKEHLDLEARIGPQAAAAKAHDGLVEARRRAAVMFDCRPGQVAFGTTCAQLWSLLFHAQKLEPGGRMLVSRGEWGGNLVAIRARGRERGIAIETIATDETGRIDTARLQEQIDDDVRLIAVTAVSSVNGILQPAGAVGALARPPGCLYFLDAAQAAGRFPVTLGATRADVITAPARKWLRGPRGQAVAALSSAALLRLTAPPLWDIAGMTWPADGEPSPRGDAGRFEGAEFAVAGRLGFGAALAEWLDAGPAAVTRAIGRHIGALREGLAACDGVTVFEPEAGDAAFLTFSCKGAAPDAVAGGLAEAGIAIANQQRIYAPLELTARGLLQVLRVSPHAYSHDSEIARFVETLARVLHGLRRGYGSR